MWERVSNDFMKEDNPYGPGDFRIRGEQVVSMKLTNPEITFKPRAERSDPSRAEPTEAWMSNVNERANRRSVRILEGHLVNGIEQRFEERAQQAEWWLSPSWNTIYLATGWTNYYDEPAVGQRYTPQLTQLFKSTDQGQEWEKLRWPEDQNITFLRFLDAQRGYLIGWGPKIWRTRDGGDHWDELPVPEGSRNPENPRQQFDLVALGQDNVLRLAFYDHAADASRIHALPWGEEISQQTFMIPGHVVMDIAANSEGNVYVLTTQGAPYFSLPAEEREAPRPSVVWSWNGDTLERLHEFPPELKGYALYLTPEEGLLVDGVDESSLMGSDVTAVSYDGGGSWKIEDEGRSAQGGYYDAQTGTRWRVEGYSLYRREIP
ncbi:WD40/YVTN/BNR-like repeat-containing protein [Billgrantia sp. C5P2]|uniref:WD40/YVTN/BNR-like repeat-containing protein n=1 Tax=Billgrantia sp. C5P2 TaxID=3436239 RepID=UPI003DA62E3B